VDSNRARVEALAWVDYRPMRILVPGLVQTGEECRSTSSTFAESATGKRGLLATTDKWGYMYLGQFSPSRRDTVVSSLGLHARAFVR
jgi:hypothetical protein